MNSAAPSRGHRFRELLVLFTLFAAVPAVDAGAQTHLGTVRGTIRDASGVVPGADVLLVNDETSVSRVTTSNGRGEYALSSVSPGAYTVKVSLAGFKTVESREIRIGTDDAIALDLVLEPGELRETVIVVGATPVIERASASVSSVVDRRRRHVQ